MAVAVESDGFIELCINMTTEPVNAMLATQVNLTLSTLSGTGIIIEKNQE